MGATTPNAWVRSFWMSLLNESALLDALATSLSLFARSPIASDSGWKPAERWSLAVLPQVCAGGKHQESSRSSRDSRGIFSDNPR